jgi:hypothetical protein
MRRLARLLSACLVQGDQVIAVISIEITDGADLFAHADPIAPFARLAKVAAR